MPGAWKKIGEPALDAGGRVLTTAIARQLASKEFPSLGSRGRELAFLLGAIQAAEARLIEMTSAGNGREAREAARDEVQNLSEYVLLRRDRQRTEASPDEHLWPPSEPEPRSRSVRALQGGLPTLGKRHR